MLFVYMIATKAHLPDIDSVQHQQQQTKFEKKKLDIK